MTISLKGLAVFGALALGHISLAQTPQLIVRLQPGANPYLLAKKYRLKLVDRTPAGPFALFQLQGDARFNGNATRLAQIRLRLAAEPRVMWVEDDAQIDTPEGSGRKGSVLPVVGDRVALQEANAGFLTQINWSESLSLSPGRSVTVAVLDTGLSPVQNRLWLRTVASENMVEPGQPAWDIARNTDTNGSGTFDDAVGHGTMIAGIIDQVAPKTNLAIARVADSDGRSSAWRVVKGLAFAVGAGAEVANISLASQEGIAALSDVMDWCEEKNLVVVAAIGNDSLDRASHPSRVDGVISVAGLNPDNTKADFSNWENKATAAAPAVGIISQSHTSNMGVWSGTSFATPFVTAAIGDCLRRTGKINSLLWQGLLTSSGKNIDNVNPAYAGELGRMLDIIALNNAAQGVP
jgi:subtilisin family serine protease